MRLDDADKQQPANYLQKFIKMENINFRVEKRNIYQTNYHQTRLSELEEGEIRLKIDQYALTSNNISYAMSGFSSRYWEFFPTEEPYGIIPVWGYAYVVASKHVQIEVGERYYGFFPMSTFCTLKPYNVNPYSFSDGSTHRRGLAATYNNYTRETSNTLLHQEELQNDVPNTHLATSFMLYQFLKNQDFMGAEQVVITSASAKTSLGLALILCRYQAADGKKIVGLTSNEGIGFVKSTNYYDEIISYADYKSISRSPLVVIDIRGNRNFLINLSNEFNEQITHIAKVGVTDWREGSKHSDIPKAKPFFAPAPLLELELVSDSKQLSKSYVDMVNGKINSKKGYLVNIQ